MTKVTNDEMRDMIDYHIVYSDEKNQYPNVWIMMMYLHELQETNGFSILLEYWRSSKIPKITLDISCLDMLIWLHIKLMRGQK